MRTVMKKEQGQRNDSVSTPNLNVHDRSIKASDIIIQLRGTKNVADETQLMYLWNQEDWFWWFVVERILGFKVNIVRFFFIVLNSV